MIKIIKKSLFFTFLFHVILVVVFIYLFPSFEWRLKIIVSFELIIIFKLFIIAENWRIWEYRIRKLFNGFYEVIKTIIYFISMGLGIYYTKEAIQDPNDLLLSTILLITLYILIVIEKLINFINSRPLPTEFDTRLYRDTSNDPKVYTNSENQDFIGNWMITHNNLADEEGRKRPYGNYNPYIKKYGDWDNTESYIPGSNLPTYLKLSGKEPSEEDDPEYHDLKRQIEEIHMNDWRELQRRNKGYLERKKKDI